MTSPWKLVTFRCFSLCLIQALRHAAVSSWKRSASPTQWRRSTCGATATSHPSTHARWLHFCMTCLRLTCQVLGLPALPIFVDTKGLTAAVALVQCAELVFTCLQGPSNLSGTAVTSCKLVRQLLASDLCFLHLLGVHRGSFWLHACACSSLL